MAFVVFEDYPEIIDAQQAERLGKPFWPTVRLGTFGAVDTPAKPPCRKCAARKFQVGLDRPAYRIGQPGPFGAAPTTSIGTLANGSIVLLATGEQVAGPNGDPLRLLQPVQFKIGKSLDAATGSGAWTPASTDVSFNKDAVVIAVDPVVTEPVASPGSSFSAQPGMAATIPAGTPFLVTFAETGSDARFAALTTMPVGADRRALNRVGTIIAVASAITVVGLFAATISLGKSKLRRAAERG